LTPWPSLPIGVSSAQLIAATRQGYGHHSWWQAFDARLYELRHLIVPLLVSVWPRTVALMCLGVIARKRCWIPFFRTAERARIVKWSALLLGTIATGARAYCASSGISLGRIDIFLDDIGVVGLAIFYSLFVLRQGAFSLLIRTMAPAGRLSLSIYLMQTFVLSLLFYGYGLGWYERMGSFAGVGLGMAFFLAQVGLSHLYLWRFRLGPVEWLWRRLTYL
jgi:uncharacterized protein